MEELGIRPNVSIVSMVGNVFKELGMMDKYHKLKKKYPPPRWEYRYIKGKRVKIRAKDLEEFDSSNKDVRKHATTDQTSNDMNEEAETSSAELEIEANDSSSVVEEAAETSNRFYEEAETSSDDLKTEVNVEAEIVTSIECNLQDSVDAH